MPPRGISGSAGTEPEQPSDQPPADPGTLAATPTATTGTPGTPASGRSPSGPALGTASVSVRNGSVVVEVDGRRGRLSPSDVARLGSLAAARERQEAVGAELRDAIDAARANEAALLALPGVVAVRAGFKFVDGRITPTPAVVVAVDRKRDDLPPADRVPPQLPGGMPTDIAIADPLDRLRRAGGAEAAAQLPGPPLLIEQVQGDDDAVLEAVPPITYVPPAGASLAPITGPMKLTSHVSPDAGWEVLRPFLAATKASIVLGMYDFTAPHIYRAARSVLRGSSVRWRSTLDLGEDLPDPDDTESSKAEDKPEAWINLGLARAGGRRFQATVASTGSGRTFASAYHIKVVVRDDEAIWLSSGNWQSTNQPAIDFSEPDVDLRQLADYNREWNLVIESPGLATTFRTYLDGDFETASSVAEAAAAPVQAGPEVLVPAASVDELAVPLQVFPAQTFTFDDARPLTVQPILTPDNYLDVVLELLRQRPQERLYFQNQSLNPILTPTARWSELMRLLAEYSLDDRLDVRIIIRDIGAIRKKLESLQLAGFAMDRVRVQRGCHTKGMVIDGTTLLLGSHNWTNEGVEANRDASVLIRDADIAAYYERVFVHDWERLARPSIREDVAPIPVLPGGEAAALEEADGARRIRWSEWAGG